MKSWQLAAAAGICAALTGCATPDSGSVAAHEDGPTATSAVPMEPGMTMANGQTMGPISPGTASSSGQPAEPAAGRPSATARMVCGDEIAGDVAALAALSATLPGTSTWADRLFTCTYRLPAGPLVLSVKDSRDEAAGRAYFDSVKATLGRTHRLHGLQSLGLPSYESLDGTVVFLKDGKTLTVDATALTSGVGAHRASPAEVAYQIGSDVIGCWAEDD